MNRHRVLIMAVVACFTAAMAEEAQAGATKATGGQIEAWSCAASSAPFAKRVGHAVVSFGNCVYVIGGSTSADPGYYNIGGVLADVWRSNDGTHWQNVTYEARFGALYEHAAAVYDDKLWVLGGWRQDTPSAGADVNDVWSTPDGENWTQMGTPEWVAREGHRAIAFGNKFWVLGGSHKPTDYFQDAWSTTNGNTWTQENLGQTPMWSGRYLPGVTVFNSELWVLGGNTSLSPFYLSDMWHSENGANWTLSGPSDAWSARDGFGCVAHNGELWVMGGAGSSGFFADAWRSSTGTGWFSSAVPWTNRAFFGAVEHKGRIWVVGGMTRPTPSAFDELNDVWLYGLPVSSYTLTMTPGTNGSITTTTSTIPEQPGPTFTEFTDLCVNAVPDNGYSLSAWTGDLVSANSDNPTTLIMDGDKTIGAQFDLTPSFKLTLLSSVGGTIGLDPPQPADGYAKGTEVTLTATAQGNYAFQGWYGALAGTQNPATLSIDGPTGVGAQFTRPGAEGEGEWTGGPWAACFADCAANSPDNDHDGLTACQEACIGTSDGNVDSDDDGMPDGWEARHSLDPLADDSALDADNDSVTNLEEYLGRSDPQDPASPYRMLFVSNAGSDDGGNGSFETPFQTLTHALGQAGAGKSTPVRIVLLPGTYAEGLVELPSFVQVVSRKQDPPAVIVGGIMGAQDTLLSHLKIMPDTDGPGWLLQMNLSRMRVDGVVFEGSADARTGSGITAYGAAPLESVIENCEFRYLHIGIELFGGIPTIRRCIFEQLSGSGIVVHSWDDPQADAGTLGDTGDPGTGWNLFSLTIAGPAVINERSTAISMQNNDWGTNDPVAVGGRIQGQNVHEPFLATGNSLLASAIFCSVVDAGTSAPLTDATVTMQISAYRPVTENSRGVYSFPAVPDGSYTVTATAPGRVSAQRTVSVAQGSTKSVTLPLAVVAVAEGEGQAEGEGEGEGEGEPGTGGNGCNCSKERHLPAAGDLFVSALGLIALASMSRPEKRY